MIKKNEQVHQGADKILICILALTLFLIYMVQLPELRMISIIGDEFGYWASGAYLAGFDWSNVASYNSYYSYGYGIWLYLILKIAKTPLVAYKLAMILNDIFVVGTFVLLIFLGRHAQYKHNKKGLICIAFSLMLFSGIYFAAHTSQCETILLFFFMIELELLFSYIEKASALKTILLWINTIYLYTVHQRMLVIIIALLAVLFIDAFFCERQNRKYFILGIFCLAGLFFLTQSIKGLYLEKLYQNGKAVVSNNYSGQVGKIQMLLSGEGIRTFVMGVLGKIYYLGVSTFGLFYYGFFYLGARIYAGINAYRKGIKKDTSVLVALFLVLTILGAVGISTIQLLDNKRIDTLIYGRYTEYLIPVVCGVGMFGVFKIPRKAENVICMLQMILVVALCYQLKLGNYSQLYPNNIAAIGNLYYITWNKYSFMTYVVLGANLLSIVFIYMIRSQKKVIAYAGIFLLAIVWLFYGYSGTDAQLVSFYEKNQFSVVENVLDQMPEESTIYYYPENTNETFAYLNADYLQFLAYRKPVKIVSENPEAEKLQKGDVLVLPASAETGKMECYILVDKNEKFKIYGKKQ